METKQLRKEAKILVTDLSAGRDTEENQAAYTAMTASAFASYARIKLSMNLFTLREMEQEKEELGQEKDADSWTVLEAVRGLSEEHPEAGLEQTKALRDRITARMKVLTAYTDFFEQHEYILNRKEAGILGETESISPEASVMRSNFGARRPNSVMTASTKDGHSSFNSLLRIKRKG